MATQTNKVEQKRLSKSGLNQLIDHVIEDVEKYSNLPDKNRFVEPEHLVECKSISQSPIRGNELWDGNGDKWDGNDSDINYLNFERMCYE